MNKKFIVLLLLTLVIKQIAIVAQNDIVDQGSGPEAVMKPNAENEPSDCCPQPRPVCCPRPVFRRRVVAPRFVCCPRPPYICRPRCCITRIGRPACFPLCRRICRPKRCCPLPFLKCRPKPVCCPRFRCCRPKPPCCPVPLPPCPPLPCIKTEPIIEREQVCPCEIPCCGASVPNGYKQPIEPNVVGPNQTTNNEIFPDEGL